MESVDLFDARGSDIILQTRNGSAAPNALASTSIANRSPSSASEELIRILPAFSGIYREN